MGSGGSKLFGGDLGLGIGDGPQISSSVRPEGSLLPGALLELKEKHFSSIISEMMFFKVVKMVIY